MVGILDYNGTINFSKPDESIPPPIVVNKCIKMMRHKIMLGIVSHVGPDSPHREKIETYRENLAFAIADHIGRFNITDIRMTLPAPARICKDALF